MTKTIEIYDNKEVEVKFKNVEEYLLPVESGMRSVLLMIYTMIPSESFGKIIERIFKENGGFPSEENFMFEFWNLCREEWNKEL